jgi:hypothetical protein
MAEINLAAVGHSYGGPAYALEKADLQLEDNDAKHHFGAHPPF